MSAAAVPLAAGLGTVGAHAPPSTNAAPPVRRTALAFVCAPAAPAALAALAAAGMGWSQGGMVDAIGAFFGVGAALAFGGYASALLIAVPIYSLALRRRAIPPAASILLGGVAAAAPWATLGVVSGEDTVMVLAAATFGLGCVGGLVFTLVRDGWPRPGGGALGGGGT